MTKEKAYAVTKALNDIDDFELLMDQIEMACNNVEGDFDAFIENTLMPVLRAELERREKILEVM